MKLESAPIGALYDLIFTQNYLPNFTMQFIERLFLIKVILFFRDILHGIAVAEEFDFGPEPTIEVLAFLQ